MRSALILGSAALLAAIATIVWCLRSPEVPPTAGPEGDRAAAESAPSSADPAADAGAATAQNAAATPRSLLQRVDGSIPRSVHQVRVRDAHRHPVEGAEVRWRDAAGTVLATTLSDEVGLSGCPTAAATAQAFHPACGASARKELGDRVLRLDLVRPLDTLDAPPEPEPTPLRERLRQQQREPQEPQFDEEVGMPPSDFVEEDDSLFGLSAEQADARTPGIEVDIVVSDAAGRPLHAASIFELRGARTDADRHRTKLGRTDAAGLLRARLDPGDRLLHAAIADEVGVVPPTVVQVESGMAPTVRLVAAPTVEVSGTVEGVGELPQAMRRIDVRGAAAPWLDTDIGVAVSEHGDFVAHLPAGEWLCVGAGWLPGRDRVRTGIGIVRLARRSTIVVTVLRADGSPAVRAFAVPAECPTSGRRSGSVAESPPHGWPLHRLLLSTALADSRVVIGDEHHPGELAMFELAKQPDGPLAVRLQPTASLVVVPMHRGQLARGLDVELRVPGFRDFERCEGADGAVFQHAPSGMVTVAVLRAGQVLFEQQVELQAGGTLHLEPVVTL